MFELKSPGCKVWAFVVLGHGKVFKITTGAGSQYYMASVIGVLIFVVVAVLSLIIYNVLPSNKNEEDYQ